MSTIPIIVADEEETKPKSGLLGGGTSPTPNKGVQVKNIPTELLCRSFDALSTQRVTK
jgi:hypothetical protein